jgi:hypothetical protein
MSIGNLGAAPGAQPAAGPIGAPIWASTPASIGQTPGQAGNPAPTGGVTYFNSSFESVMAAVSRGELSLNALVANNNQFGGNAANIQAQQGNPTLLQAISQGLPQNGTNGINGVGAGGGTVNSSMASTGNQPGSFDNNSAMGGTQTIDAKQTVTGNTQSAVLLSPAQYGGN